MNKKEFFQRLRGIAFSVSISLALSVVSVSAGYAASNAVSYKNDIQPIFDTYCVACHKPGGIGQQTSGLDLSSHAGAMKGTKFGSIIVPGDVLTSNLMAVLEGRTDASIAMPHNGNRAMTKNDRRILRKWIGEGATKMGYEVGPVQVIEELCLSCHVPGGSGYESSGLDMRTYESLMKGTRHGPIIVPGDAFTSNLMVLVEGRSTNGLKMPHNAQGAPTSKDRQMLRRWIIQGAAND